LKKSAEKTILNFHEKNLKTNVSYIRSFQEQLQKENSNQD